METLVNQVTMVHYNREISCIGVVADTHVPNRARFLPPRLFKLLADVQLILHAGDLVDEGVIRELSAIAPVEAVAGNMDPLKLQQQLGRLKLIKIGQLGIGLLHGDLGGRKVVFERMRELFLPEIPAAIVFGHLHEPLIRKIGQTLFFNPGSAVEPRRDSRASCGRIIINGNQVSGEIINI
jgi:uncharacterized protein